VRDRFDDTNPPVFPQVFPGGRKNEKKKTRAARKWGARSAGFEGEILAADA
jgi:hypothetical protein